MYQKVMEANLALCYSILYEIIQRSFIKDSSRSHNFSSKVLISNVDELMINFISNILREIVSKRYSGHCETLDGCKEF